MTYTARELPNGTGVVLDPDGLTWESEHPTLAAARRHVERLADWLQSKPTTGEPVLITDAFCSVRELCPEGVELLRILDAPWVAAL